MRMVLTHTFICVGFCIIYYFIDFERNDKSFEKRIRAKIQAIEAHLENVYSKASFYSRYSINSNVMGHCLIHFQVFVINIKIHFKITMNLDK